MIPFVGFLILVGVYKDLFWFGFDFGCSGFGSLFVVICMIMRPEGIQYIILL